MDGRERGQSIGNHDVEQPRQEGASLDGKTIWLQGKSEICRTGVEPNKKAPSRQRLSA